MHRKRENVGRLIIMLLTQGLYALARIQEIFVYIEAAKGRPAYIHICMCRR